MNRNPAGIDPSGGVLRLRTPHGQATVTVTSEAGLVDLNNASPPLLAALIQAVGEGEEAATTIAQSILAWHTSIPPEQQAAIVAPYQAAHLGYGPPGSAFESVDELALVVGVTPALFARLAPHLTVFQGGDPVLSLADPVVRQAAAAIGENEAAATDPAANDVVRLHVVERAGGGIFVRDGVVQLEPGEAGTPYRVLTWTHPAG